MVKKMREYLDAAFESAPKTRKAQEMKEELFTNLIEKYNDQLKQGKDEEEAYGIVMASVGNISDLVDSLRQKEPVAGPSPEQRKKSALAISIAVMLYILSPIALIWMDAYNQPDELSLTVLLGLCAIATGILIYNSASRPKYGNQAETMVEDFKEWQNNSHSRKKAYRDISGAYWCLVVAAYLYLSFAVFGWSYTWIIFIVASALQSIAHAIFVLTGGR